MVTDKTPSERLIRAAQAANAGHANLAITDGADPFWKNENGVCAFGELTRYSGIMASDMNTEGFAHLMRGTMNYMMGQPLHPDSQETLKEMLLKAEEEFAMALRIKKETNTLAILAGVKLSSLSTDFLSKENRAAQMMRDALLQSSAWQELNSRMSANEKFDFKNKLKNAQSRGEMRGRAEVSSFDLTEEGHIAQRARAYSPAPSKAQESAPKTAELEAPRMSFGALRNFKESHPTATDQSNHPPTLKR